MNALLNAPMKSPAPKPISNESLASLVAKPLAEVERRIDSVLKPHRDSFPEVLEHLEAYRGKRLRPTLALLVGQALGESRNDTLIDVAAVLELIHTATLVHDDILDGASKRRQTTTMHKRWGCHAAILLGDLLFSEAYRLASATGDARIGEMVGEATTRVCAGEMLQTLRGKTWDVTEADYYRMIDGKTAALTECACRLAAYVCGAEQGTIEAMATCGLELGRAFQVSDDLIDILGDERVAGKTLGTDLEQQKATLPVIRFLRRARPDQAAVFHEHHRDPAVIRDLFRKAGVAEEVEAAIDGHIRKAKKCLEALPAGPERLALAVIVDGCRKRRV